MRYKYTAKDTTGKIVYGEIDAATQEKVANVLKEQSLYPIDVEEVKSGFMGLVASLGGVSTADVVVFTRQFSTMISAGLSVSRCLRVLYEQTTSEKFRTIIGDIDTQVASGTSLSNAFARYPTVFSNTFIALCKAGESSGKLDDVLQKLADTLERDADIKGRFKTAMIYPTIICVAMLGVFVLMMIVVVPRLSELYTSMNVELPGITKLMIGISDFMLNYKFVLIPAIAMAIFGIKILLATPEGRTYWSEFMFAVPVLGKVNKLKDYTLLTRTLSMLLTSGVSLVEALGISADVVSSLQLRVALRYAMSQVERGVFLSNAMSQNKLFPPMFYKIVQVGEETGNLDTVLSRLSTYYTNETDTAISRLSAALEPFILVFLGVGVGGLILSIITPIYKITASI